MNTQINLVSLKRIANGVRLPSLVFVVACLLTACASTANNLAPATTIVDLAKANTRFSTLVTLIEAAGLTEVLQNRQAITLFAPDNSAFSRLPRGDIAYLLQPDHKEELIAILSYHIALDRIATNDEGPLTVAETLNGQRLSVRTVAGSMTVDRARVIATAIPAGNGSIQPIDTVLLPGHCAR